jgi:hypothetical protein
MSTFFMAMFISILVLVETDWDLQILYRSKQIQWQQQSRTQWVSLPTHNLTVVDLWVLPQ